jgi:hypothetical protein
MDKVSSSIEKSDDIRLHQPEGCLLLNPVSGKHHQPLSARCYVGYYFVPDHC